MRFSRIFFLKWPTAVVTVCSYEPIPESGRNLKIPSMYFCNLSENNLTYTAYTFIILPCQFISYTYAWNQDVQSLFRSVLFCFQTITWKIYHCIDYCFWKWHLSWHRRNMIFVTFDSKSFNRLLVPWTLQAMITFRNFRSI